MIEIIAYHLIGVLFGVSGLMNLHFCIYHARGLPGKVLLLIGSSGKIICGLGILVYCINLGLHSPELTTCL